MSTARAHAPIVFFGFNRPSHARTALASLAGCQGAALSDLIVYIDGPRHEAEAETVDEVFRIAAAQKGFKSVTIVRRKENIGCAASIAAAVDETLREHPRAIFIEDDLVCAPGALTYFNDALERYEDCPAVMTVCGYSYPEHLLHVPADYDFDVYFTPGFFSWGWATWRRVLPFIDWKARDYATFARSRTLVRNFDSVESNLSSLLAMQQSGETDDWVAPLVLSQFRNNFVSLCPARSLVDNIGHDGSGIHCPQTSLFRNRVLGEAPECYPPYVFVDAAMRQNFSSVMSRSIFSRARRRALDLRLSASAWLAAIGVF